MGFFDEISDTFKVVKDIVHGGIETFKAGEKLDELIVRVEKDFVDVLTDDDKILLARYKTSKQACDDGKTCDTLDDDRVAFLTAAEKNSSLPGEFRFEIKLALKDFVKVANFALESAGNTIEKYAETDEQRAEIRKVFDESKRK